MSRKCERCQCDISVSYLLNQKSCSEIRCPNCGRILEVTSLSKVLVLCYYALGLLGVSVFPIKIIGVVIFQVLWTIVSYYYLPAFIYLH